MRALVICLCVSLPVMPACNGSGDGNGHTDAKTCIQTCTQAADCCPAGAGNCPGPHPYNYLCEAGLCRSGGCTGDDQCPWQGAVCKQIGGVGLCLFTCTEDNDCFQPNSAEACLGKADDGTRYCFEPCTSPYRTCGEMICDEESGLCTCTDDSQCAEGMLCAT